jgi:2'-5' RNA ligase
MNNHDDLGVERLFLAALPDADTAARIHRLAATLKRAHRFLGTLTSADCLHISLFFVGGLHDAGLRAACEAADEAAATPPFAVSFDLTASFGGRAGNHPLVLCGDGGLNQLRSFRQTFAAAMLRKGLRQPARTNFAPHVTLLYGERRVEENPIDAICWTVREFVLIRSKQGHVHLARWALGQRSARERATSSP